MLNTYTLYINVNRTKVWRDSARFHEVLEQRRNSSYPAKKNYTSLLTIFVTVFIIQNSIVLGYFNNL